jgi:hypothetical protein
MKEPEPLVWLITEFPLCQSLDYHGRVVLDRVSVPFYPQDVSVAP